MIVFLIFGIISNNFPIFCKTISSSLLIFFWKALLDIFPWKGKKKCSGTMKQIFASCTFKKICGELMRLLVHILYLRLSLSSSSFGETLKAIRKAKKDPTTPKSLKALSLSLSLSLSNNKLKFRAIKTILSGILTNTSFNLAFVTLHQVPVLADKIQITWWSFPAMKNTLHRSTTQEL